MAKNNNKKMVEGKTWEEFRKSGLLLIINQVLHIFGWAIVVEIDCSNSNKILKIYPARVKFRGFSRICTEHAYTQVSKYMKENASELLEESEEQ